MRVLSCLLCPLFTIYKTWGSLLVNLNFSLKCITSNLGEIFQIYTIWINTPFHLISCLQSWVVNSVCVSRVFKLAWLVDRSDSGKNIRSYSELTVSTLAWNSFSYNAIFFTFRSLISFIEFWITFRNLFSLICNSSSSFNKKKSSQINSFLYCCSNKDIYTFVLSLTANATHSFSTSLASLCISSLLSSPDCAIRFFFNCIWCTVSLLRIDKSFSLNALSFFVRLSKISLTSFTRWSLN